EGPNSVRLIDRARGPEVLDQVHQRPVRRERIEGEAAAERHACPDLHRPWIEKNEAGASTRRGGEDEVPSVSREAAHRSVPGDHRDADQTVEVSPAKHLAIADPDGFDHRAIRSVIEGDVPNLPREVRPSGPPPARP